MWKSNNRFYNCVSWDATSSKTFFKFLLMYQYTNIRNILILWLSQHAHTEAAYGCEEWGAETPKRQRIYGVRACLQRERGLGAELHGNRHLLTACTVVHSMLKKAECTLLHNHQTGTECWEGSTCRQGFMGPLWFFFSSLTFSSRELAEVKAPVRTHCYYLSLFIFGILVPSLFLA